MYIYIQYLNHYIFHVYYHLMVRMTTIPVPADAVTPFGGQPMSTFMDKIKFPPFYWSSHRDIIKNGVMMSKDRFGTHAKHTEMLRKVAKIADKNGPYTNMAHLKFERLVKPSKGSPFWNVRGGLMFSSKSNLCRLVSQVIKGDINLGRSTEFTQIGLYWENLHGPSGDTKYLDYPSFPHPYVDIDLLFPEERKVEFSDVYPFVYEGISALSESFAQSDGKEHSHEYAIFFNQRSTQKNKQNMNKFSFHIHWYALVCQSISHLKERVFCFSPHMPIVSPDGENPKLIPGESDTLFDMSVYKPSQLFRLPFVGKGGDASAKMTPIEVIKVDDEWTYKLHPDIENVELWLKRSCTHTNNPTDYVMLKEQTHVRPTSFEPLPPPPIVQRFRYTEQDTTEWMDFMSPIVKKFILPNWTAFRQRLALKLNATTISPDLDSVALRSEIRLPQYPCTFQYEPVADCFCEYDTRPNSKYSHKEGRNCVSYYIDFLYGKIAQQCKACEKPDGLRWYSFIQVNSLTFDILGHDENQSMQTDIIMCKDPCKVSDFFVRFFSEEILRCNDTKRVMVFNRERGIWFDGTDATFLGVRLERKLNTMYENYRKRWIFAKTEQLIIQATDTLEDAELESAIEKIKNEQKKQLGKIPKLWKMEGGQRKTLLEYLSFEYVAHVVDSMEKDNAHLVPLLHANAIDLYTWQVVDMKPEHHFTSCLNAELIPLQDERCKQFLEWQRQVCCFDEEYLQWKLLVFGISMTLFKFDRAFYMPLGPIGRNGKSSEAFLMSKILCDHSPFRGCQISREYLCKTAQDNKTASAPDSELLHMCHKTYLVVDECRDTQIDGALIKTLVSGDRSHARALYQNDMVPVDNNGSLWIIANKVLKLDYSDPALMNRIRIMPYAAEWVDDPAETRKKLSIDKAMNIHQSIGTFKEDYLVKWRDAMVTVCLHALHRYFAGLPKKEGSSTIPKQLQQFPVPTAVRQYTKQTIAAQQPLLLFIQKYLRINRGGENPVSLSVAFNNFRVFAQNENNVALMKTNRLSFEGDLAKNHINIIDIGGDKFLEGRSLKKECVLLKPGEDYGPGFTSSVAPDVDWNNGGKNDNGKRPRVSFL